MAITNLRTATPIDRSKAHEALQGSYDLLHETKSKLTDVHPGCIMWDYWESSTSRKGVRTYRLRIMAMETYGIGFVEGMSTPNPDPAYSKALHEVAAQIMQRVQEILPPSAYRMIKYKATEHYNEHISIIIWYKSNSK